GSVSGGNSSSDLGGLCGVNLHGLIKNCYAAGSVSGDYDLGGLCGMNDNGSIENCHATGSVSGGNSSSDLGGLCGSNYSGGTITSCFWDKEASGISTSEGGTGLTTAEMQTLGTFTDAGWDFAGEAANGSNEVWFMPAGSYPLLNGVTDLKDGIEIAQLAVADRRRVGRSEFEYDITLKLVNGGGDISSGQISLAATPANIEIATGGSLGLGALAGGQAGFSTGELTLRIDRSVRTDESRLTWQAELSRGPGPASMEVVTCSFEPELFGEAGLGWPELMELAESWLGEGIADVNFDGEVNYIDLAIIGDGLDMEDFENFADEIF
ncbi:GLUG motif-containing protein, partial [Sedimentisphaera salicampi]|uniref:GLUG motif-containing protein n=1 Tax=Sedimentisphaera salicampi TaxID=1941349 RepID=UPI00195EB295